MHVEVINPNTLIGDTIHDSGAQLELTDDLARRLLDRKAVKQIVPVDPQLAQALAELAAYRAAEAENAEAAPRAKARKLAPAAESR